MPIEPFRCYQWDKRTPFPEVPASIVPEEAWKRLIGDRPESVNLLGVAADGAALVEYYSRPAPDGWDQSLGIWRRIIFRQGEIFELESAMTQSPGFAEISGDGRTVVAVAPLSKSDIRISSYRAPDLLTFEIWKDGYMSEKFALRDLPPSSGVVSIVPAQFSRLHA